MSKAKKKAAKKPTQKTPLMPCCRVCRFYQMAIKFKPDHEQTHEYFLYSEPLPWGYCRRHAPSLTASYEPKWPAVAEDDWCGDWCSIMDVGTQREALEWERGKQR